MNSRATYWQEYTRIKVKIQWKHDSTLRKYDQRPLTIPKDSRKTVSGQKDGKMKEQLV